MISSLILGMGVPTTANYVITSTIAAPALIRIGVPVIAAHMFVFYFGIIADVTPPVALAAYTASGIAKSNPMQTGVNASKLAIAAFLIPYIFVTSPTLLLVNATLPLVVRMIATSLIGMVGVGAAVNGFLVTAANLVERLLFFVGGLLLIQPAAQTDIIGIALLLAAYLSQRVRLARKRTEGARM
jgi:TRAP-type uncharacterized transport system fused permease subunit